MPKRAVVAGLTLLPGLLLFALPGLGRPVPGGKYNLLGGRQAPFHGRGALH